MAYFSERKLGSLPRVNNEINETVWGGIESFVKAKVADGSFGASYPKNCPDGNVLIGTEEDGFWRALKSRVPNLPKQIQCEDTPKTLDVLDMIEFCWGNIAQPTIISYHGYFKHNDLRFDEDAREIGQKSFREEINEIFRRNGIAYTLTEAGKIERLVYTVLSEELASARFQTEDSGLNSLLEKAHQKFLDPREDTHRESLEALWDAWDRLKTLDMPDKKAGITAILNDTAGSASPKFREAIEREAKELTKIGNQLQIRHSETNQEKVVKTEHIDYLFHRLFSLIQMILRVRGQSRS